jgi:hypothetical protein
MLGLKYSRIQFMPGLMPAGIAGSMIIDTEGGAKTFLSTRLKIAPARVIPAAA